MTADYSNHQVEKAICIIGIIICVSFVTLFTYLAGLIGFISTIFIAIWFLIPCIGGLVWIRTGEWDRRRALKRNEIERGNMYDWGGYYDPELPEDLVIEEKGEIRNDGG